MSADVFRDWIPAGEAKGGQGSTFKDFVPPVQPQVKEEVKVVEPEMSFKCGKCDFVAKSAFGLLAHQKKHEVKVK